MDLWLWMCSTEKSLGEHGAKLSEEDKAAITKTIEEAKAALEKEDAADLMEKVRTRTRPRRLPPRHMHLN